MAKYVLIVDDDPLFTVSTSYILQQVGYKTATAGTAEDALAIVKQQPPDLILLDIGLPGMDGLEALRHIQHPNPVPVIFVTARRRELDEIVGLEMGADDYITKPFDEDVLLARIKALLRRSAVHSHTTPTSIQPIVVGDLRIDTASHEVWVGNRLITMSPKEFDLLLVLAQEPGHVLNIDELVSRVWGADWFGESQTVYVHVRWVREKIEENPAEPRRLITVKGAGYKLIPVKE